MFSRTLEQQERINDIIDILVEDFDMLVLFFEEQLSTDPDEIEELSSSDADTKLTEALTTLEMNEIEVKFSDFSDANL
jgi:hypothetical protein